MKISNLVLAIFALTLSGCSGFLDGEGSKSDGGTPQVQGRPVVTMNSLSEADLKVVSEFFKSAGRVSMALSILPRPGEDEQDKGWREESIGKLSVEQKAFASHFVDQCANSSPINRYDFTKLKDVGETKELQFQNTIGGAGCPLELRSSSIHQATVSVARNENTPRTLRKSSKQKIDISFSPEGQKLTSLISYKMEFKAEKTQTDGSGETSKGSGTVEYVTVTGKVSATLYSESSHSEIAYSRIVEQAYSEINLSVYGISVTIQVYRDFVRDEKDVTRIFLNGQAISEEQMNALFGGFFFIWG
jgi:hypothetical protein